MAEKKEKAFIGQATAEQIKEWKEAHGDVFTIKTEDKQENTHIGYLKKPKRKHISAATVAGKVDPLKFNETLLRECWLGGSEEIRKDDDMFMSASGVLDQLLDVKEAELEKL